MFDISRLVAKTFCTIGIHWNKGEIHQRSSHLSTVLQVSPPEYKPEPESLYLPF